MPSWVRNERRTACPSSPASAGFVDRRQSVFRQDERPHLLAVGLRRPWMVLGLLAGSAGVVVIALAPNIPVGLVGWSIAQFFFMLLAAEVAVLPDQVPETQRGTVAGVLGICTPVASVTGTFLVKLFTGNLLVMFVAPSVIGGFFILLFALVLHDRRLAAADKPPWSLKE